MGWVDQIVIRLVDDRKIERKIAGSIDRCMEWQGGCLEYYFLPSIFVPQIFLMFWVNQRFFAWLFLGFLLPLYSSPIYQLHFLHLHVCLFGRSCFLSKYFGEERTLWVFRLIMGVGKGEVGVEQIRINKRIVLEL